MATASVEKQRLYLKLSDDTAQVCLCELLNSHMQTCNTRHMHSAAPYDMTDNFLSSVVPFTARLLKKRNLKI